LDNEKLIELTDKFHAELNVTKDELIKRINSKIDQLDQKVTSTEHNKFSYAEDYEKSINNFSKNITRIENTIDAQSTKVSGLFSIYKGVTVIAVINVIVLLIVLFKNLNTDSNVAVIATATSTVTVISSPSDSLSPSPSASSEKPGDEKKPINEYNDLVKNYRIAYIKAVNSDDRSNLNKFITSGSSMDTYITRRLADAKNLELEFKESKVENIEEKDGYIYLCVLENIGIKESGESKFQYSEYKVKYTIKKSGDSYIFENQEEWK
jgi:hypothetical protein